MRLEIILKLCQSFVQNVIQVEIQNSPLSPQAALGGEYVY